MIRHNPAGRGHKYRPSLDQRSPVNPTADDAVSLAVLASPMTAELHVEVEHDGRTMTAPLRLLDDAGGATGGDGHLAAAAEAGEETGGLEPWSVTVGPFAGTGTVRYRFRTPGETSPWWTFTPARWLAGGGELTVHGTPSDRVVPGTLRWLVAGDHVLKARFALRLEPGEHVVGLGERFHAVDQRGWSVDAVVFEQYRNQHTRTYLPVPFAHVSGGDGWGFHVDTTRRTWFDVGSGERDRIWIEVDVAADEADVVLRLWAGDPASVLGGFLDHVGRPVAPPAWVYRPWASANEWNTQQRVEAEIGRSLAEDIPVGVVVIEAWSDEGTFTVFRDAGYQVHPDGAPHRLADFTFPPDGAWPDPAGMVKRLHDAGVKVLLWQIPLLPDHANEGRQLAADRSVLVDRGFAVLEEDGRPYRNRGWWFPKSLLPDFTSAAARAWWVEKRRYLLEDVGIDGFKTDGGEHAWGDELRYADGTRGDETNNRFPNLYAEAYHELIASTDRDGITFSRAGFTGAGRFPGHWAGDEASTWEAYRASIAAGLTAGASGVFSWGWDHGGFSGEIPDAELYLRSAAMACFCPIMQYHAEFNDHRTPSNDRTPWNIAERTGRPDVLAVYRRFAVLRDRLVPYLDSQAKAAISAGKPLMRALFFNWPDDPRIWDFPQQYLLGDDLLVAPVTEPNARTWPVYVPPGDWVDAWDGVGVPSGQVLDIQAPLDRIPVLVRTSAAAALLPVFVNC